MPGCRGIDSYEITEAEVIFTFEEGYDPRVDGCLFGPMISTHAVVTLDSSKNDITGWVDHQRSIRELERSLELVPSSILSELFLIEALLDYDRTRHSEALERLTRLLERAPDVGYVVEDLNALADARSLLERWSDRR